VENTWELILHYIAPKKAVCKNGITARLEFTVVEVLVRKFQNCGVRPEIFDKLDNS
jgi:hypothetical protein